jgi:coiled-coil and C2 domain-containing protein 2A
MPFPFCSQRRLRSLAEQLGELHQRETLHICRRRVIDLRRRLEPYLSTSRPTSPAEMETARRLAVELLKTRQERDEIECAHRLLARRMLDLWHRIKREREQQQFSATRAKLQVQLLDEPEDLADELEQELSERRLLHVLNTARDAGGPAAREAPFDEAQARAAIAERQVALRRAPDERTLVPVYTEESPASDYVLLPLDERRRLEAASRVELYAVLLVDGRVVGQTESTLIHPLDFCCRFNTCVQLQMLQAPRTLSLQLWQRKWSGFADSLLSEVFLAVPAAASPAAPRWEQYSFASERPFGETKRAPDEKPQHEGEVALHPIRCLCGQVNVSVAWATPPARAGSPSVPSASYTASVARGDTGSAFGFLDMMRVREHVRAEDLDPNAPSDVPLFALLSRGGARARGFRAFRFAKELQLVKDWFLSERLQLLQIRRDRPGDWLLLSQAERGVPLRDAEMSAAQRDLLTGLATSASAREEEEVLEDQTKHKNRVRSWAKGVVARQQRAKTGNLFVLTTKDVVREPLREVEFFKFDLNEILEKAFASHRKLRPMPMKRKPGDVAKDVPRTVEVAVQQGVDLPIRAGSAADANRTRLFVEIAFQGRTMRTDVKAGSSPMFNQRFSFPLTLPAGETFDQSAVLNLKADVTFNLFDRSEGVSSDPRDTSVRTLREEQRWLGSFTLPFASLYRAGEVKGVFSLDLPPILLGYVKDARSSSRKLVPNAALQLFVTINPLLPKLVEKSPPRFSRADQEMGDFSINWSKDCKRLIPPAARHRERPITVFAPTATGEKALVCRFVRPQPPPAADLLPRDERTLLRFVSCIPFLDDSALGVALDVWNTTRSFLDLCAGDSEEHALLLCNLFLGIGKKAYVVIGDQMPEGEVYYVLTRDGPDIKLWDANRNMVYARDPDPRGARTEPLSACPLLTVGCVFDDNNLWANIQLFERPAEMSWIFNDPKCWKPFFAPEGVATSLARGFKAPKTLQSLQVPDQLEYRRTAEEYRANLESEVEERLRKEFEDARGHRPTDWNSSVSRTLKEILKRFEAAASGGAEISQAVHDDKLEKVMATFGLQGFPLNTSLAAPLDTNPENPAPDLDALIQQLQHTRLYLVDGPKIQFAIAAYVHAYPNNVTSVWVYAAALKDKRTPGQTD